MSWRAVAILLALAVVGACSPDHPRPSADVQSLPCPNASPTPNPTSSPVSGAREVSPPRQDTPSPPFSSPTPAPPLPPFALPSFKGINYGSPRTADGQFLGTRWLQPANWPSARQALSDDLDFIAASDLGKVLRLFIGLDQAMVWDPDQGFVRFDPVALADFDQALRLFDSHGMKVIAVLFDQEEVSSPGNFRFQALDGVHAAMRQNYLRAVDQFMGRFGSSPVVAGWDLFNEAYGSLGQAGLPTPPAPDPTSPNYPDSVVHAWVHDLYVHAKCAAPNAWLTVSDTTQLYWDRAADLSRYDDSVDFYDVHIYDDIPVTVIWKGVVHKPLILGEVGAGIQDHHYENQRLNAKAVSFWLCAARAQGAVAVLAHNADGVVFPASRSGLTPTGYVLAAAQP
jgi:hypothetical protein